jgi:aspartyl-tRNA(Asn)/glutamyl-tRNA(Gln) amidotransferase subunit B
MEKGSLRLEANISVQSEEEASLGQLPAYKVEVKNLNSFRFLERSINHEIARQTEIRQTGELPVQETRGWNDDKGETYSQRRKEEAADYRYFPDPDLPPLLLERDFVEDIKAGLPELPDAKLARFQSEFGVNSATAIVFVADRASAERAELLLSQAKSAKQDVQQVANAVVNHKVATWLLEDFSKSESDVETEIQRILSEVTTLYAVDSVDEDHLRATVKAVLTDPASASAVMNYHNGKTQVMGFFVGQVMRQIGKKIDAGAVNQLITEELQGMK